MPKSRVRKKKVYTAPAELRPKTQAATKQQASPTWVPVLGIILFVVGLAWLVLFYLSNGAYPVEQWRYWNLGVGFSFLVMCLLVFSRWR